MNRNTKLLVMNAMFIAFILLLGLTPLGMIPLGFIYISLLSIPVTVGTMILGLKSGALFGIAFGTISLYKALSAPSALVSPLLAASPLWVILMCYVPRLLVPVTAWLVYRGNRSSVKRVTAAAVAGSLCNTVFYLGLMLLFYVLAGIESEKVLALIGGTGLIAGGCEALAAGLIATPVVAAIWKYTRKNGEQL